MLHSYWGELSGAAGHSVRIRFLLISPQPPQKLTTEWPNWVLKDGQIPWIQLELNLTDSVLQAIRCQSDRESGAERDHWRIVEHLWSGGHSKRNGSP
jgi:hypothetical protein